MSKLHKEFQVYSVENVKVHEKSTKRSIRSVESMPSSTDSVPGLLQIKKVTSTTAEMSDKDKLSATEKIQKAIEVIQVLLNAGVKGWEAVNPKSKLEEIWLKDLNALVGVSEIFKGIVTLSTAWDDDPMAEKLRVLRSKLGKLGAQIGKHIKRMEVKIAEIHFIMAAVAPALVILKYLQDCAERPGIESTLNFKKAYEVNTPIEMTNVLMSALKHRDTNPIRIELDRRTYKRAQIFRKWESVISRLLGHFLIIETAAMGFFGFDKTNFDFIHSKSKEIMASVDELKKSYEMEYDYWWRIKVFLEEKVSHEKINRNRLATQIQHEVARHSTTDAFFVYVGEQARKDKNFNIFCEKDDGQLMTTDTIKYNPSKTFVAIYRSFDFHSKTEKDFSKLYADIEKCKNETVVYEGSIKSMLEEKLIGPGNPLEDYPLIAFYYPAAAKFRTVNYPKNFKTDKGTTNLHLVNEDTRNSSHYSISAIF